MLVKKIKITAFRNVGTFFDCKLSDLSTAHNKLSKYELKVLLESNHESVHGYVDILGGLVGGLYFHIEVLLPNTYYNFMNFLKVGVDCVDNKKRYKRLNTNKR